MNLYITGASAPSNHVIWIGEGNPFEAKQFSSWTIILISVLLKHDIFWGELFAEGFFNGC